MKSLFFIGAVLFFLPGTVIGSDLEQKSGAIERSMPSSVVFDSSTGLYWEDTAHSTYCHGVRMDWQDAISYCESLSLQNYDDWRLPNINELQSMSPIWFRNLEPAVEFWSSTTSGKRVIINNSMYYNRHAFSVVFYDKNFDFRGMYEHRRRCPSFRVEYNGNTNGHTVVYSEDEVYAGDSIYWVRLKKSRIKDRSLKNVRCVR